MNRKLIDQERQYGRCVTKTFYLSSRLDQNNVVADFLAQEYKTVTLPILGPNCKPGGIRPAHLAREDSWKPSSRH